MRHIDLPNNYGRLALTRKPGQSVTVRLNDGNFVRVTNVGIRGGQVQLVFEAPRELNIVRDELIKDDNDARHS